METWVNGLQNFSLNMVIQSVSIVENSRQKMKDDLVESGIPEEVLSDLDDQIKSDANVYNTKAHLSMNWYFFCTYIFLYKL